MSKFSKTNLALNNPLNKSNYTFSVEGLTHPQESEAINIDPIYAETFHGVLGPGGTPTHGGKNINHLNQNLNQTVSESQEKPLSLINANIMHTKIRIAELKNLKRNLKLGRRGHSNLSLPGNRLMRHSQEIPHPLRMQNRHLIAPVV